MGFLKKLFGKKEPPVESVGVMHPLDRDIAVLYELVANAMGTENMVIEAGKMDALKLMRSNVRGERLLALSRILSRNPALNNTPKDSEIPQVISTLTEELADRLARRSLEDKIERKINEKLEQDHADYMKDIRLQVLKEEKKEMESAHDKKKREELEALEKVHLTESVMELLRPKELKDIVGEKRAVKSLMAKLSSPYPQHLILYGPPGVGKTTAARLVLEAAKKKELSPFKENAPFVETDGTTLRWDPRDITNPLLGSVHDPIYQGAQKSLADIGVPEPKPGLVTDAHGGILFIDEIGEMDDMLQNKLLKVLEDKRAFFESAYYDPADERVPPYIRKLFEEGAPADFVLIGATTRDASHINPALRSRCAEIYFEPLTPKHIVEIVENAAKKLNVELEDGIAETIAEYTIEGRKAINILADAYSLAMERQVSGDDVYSTEMPEEETKPKVSFTKRMYANADFNLEDKENEVTDYIGDAAAYYESFGDLDEELPLFDDEYDDYDNEELERQVDDKKYNVAYSHEGYYSKENLDNLEEEIDEEQDYIKEAADYYESFNDLGEELPSFEDEYDDYDNEELERKVKNKRYNVAYSHEGHYSKENMEELEEEIEDSDRRKNTFRKFKKDYNNKKASQEKTENDGKVVVTKRDVYEVAQVARLTPYVTKKGEDTARVGHIFGLGVAGFLGSAIEIEAVSFPAAEKGKGTVRFNETAGSMAKDSVFNAASVMRALTGKELTDYDLHINVIGGGNIDGPSAGVAILAVIVSAVTGRKIRQNVAVTGEISLQGRVRPVGGVFEKAYGAKQAGMKVMLIPKENEKDIPKEHLGLEIHPVETAEEAFKYIFAN